MQKSLLFLTTTTNVIIVPLLLQGGNKNVCKLFQHEVRTQPVGFE